MVATARYTVGDTEVICITDGGTSFPADVFPSLTETQRQERLDMAGLTEIKTAFNCYVLRSGNGGITLVDTGCGAAFGDDAGALPAQLVALNIAAADVTRIIFTHLHSDHCGGAMHGDTLLFPNAKILLHQAEASYWSGKDAPGGRLLGRASNIITVADDAELDDGLRVWALPGHTPGHMGLRLGDLALVGDIVHSEALQLPDPTTATIYDCDQPLATHSRLRALAAVAHENLVWSGSHMLGPDKFARLRADGPAYERITR
ncbi:MBL fold metallo-hydrolase [Yoonia sp. I 8.24]|uniref:MBL fold metallo-hydrolase n=1 Tax=Yoonia sp. I 8.24 TaxID=1537229 RepID=UPI001EDDF50E|nr:MBL fold metallo-hydrolase [Yoonia sp. I 8.24]MCG3267609.1 MBL fold metallo-hydrolase [Yoonia sp. I 8.24]